jgi:tetratricopeptide (TPR) repeat protein
MPQPELVHSSYLNSRLKIAGARGQLEEAYQLAQESMTEAWHAGQMEDVNRISLYEFLPAVLDLHRYQRQVDWALTEETLAGLVESNRSIVLAISGQAEAGLSAVCARQGRTEEARQWLERAREQIPLNTLAVAHSLLMKADLELAIAEGRWEEAISKSKSLHEWYTRAGMRWHQTHTLLDLAEIHRLRGGPEDREQARELYKHLLGIFTEIGATGYVRILQERLQMIDSNH